MRGGRARLTDQNGVAAERDGGDEGMFVGQIVSHHDRTPERERRFRHEGANRIALVGAGDLQFADAFAGLQLEPGVGGELVSEGVDRGFGVPRVAKMKGHAGWLAFDQ